MERTEWTCFDGGLALRVWDSARHWQIVHLQYALCLLQRGGAAWRYRGRHFRVEPGTAYMCEPGEVHCTDRVAGAGDFTVLFIDPERMQHVAEELGGAASVHFPALGLQSPEVVHAFHRTRAVLGVDSGEAVEQEFARLTLRLVESATPRARLATPADGLLADARALLEQRLLADPTQPIRLRPLAHELSVSYWALLHGFSQRYAVPPYRLVSLLRAQHALADLKRGPHPGCATLTELAMKWGYADSAHMARVFRKQWGASPLAVARQLNGSWKNAQQPSERRRVG